MYSKELALANAAIADLTRELANERARFKFASLSDAERDRLADLENKLNHSTAMIELLRQALIGMKHRDIDGHPCWCFMWPDEGEKCEATVGGTHCQRAQAAYALSAVLFQGAK